MRLRRAGRAVAAGAALLALCTVARASAPSPVEYLYVEANEGGSSGGHVGLRIGDSVFHHQQRDGLLRLLRDDVRDFLHAYALAGNRNVHALRLDLTERTAALLLARLEARHRAADRQLERLALLRADRRLLEEIGTRHSSGGAELSVPAAGFFAVELPAPVPARTSPTLAALRSQLSARQGRDDLEARIAALRLERERLEPYALPVLELTDVESEPPPVYAWSARHADLASAQTALELLRDAPALRSDALVAADAGNPLSDAEREALCGMREPLSDDLVDLARSSRPDWGSAFLLGAARLLALDASCRRGALLVLDAFPDAIASDEAVPAPRPEALALLARDAGDALAQARARFVGAGWDERRLADLEVAASQRAELARALRRGGRIRIPEARLVPQRGALRRDVPPAPVSSARRLRILEEARLREDELSRALDRLYAYHLVTRNCVTEIFRALHAALGDDRRAIEDRLGGWVDPGSVEGFLPFASARAVRSRYRVAGERLIPSLRSARVARVREREGWWASVRERSPWTARSYAWAARDSRFLFFSDDVPALRPLFGVANLAAGAGESLLGVLHAPWDGGAQLVAGLRGAFWSLPELAFFSVRKGSNEYVPREFVAALEAEVGAADQAVSTTTAIAAVVSGAPTRQ